MNRWLPGGPTSKGVACLCVVAAWCADKTQCLRGSGMGRPSLRGSDVDGARGKVGLESEASERAADLRRPMCSRDDGGRGGRGPCLDLPR